MFSFTFDNIDTLKKSNFRDKRFTLKDSNYYHLWAVLDPAFFVVFHNDDLLILFDIVVYQTMEKL